MTGRHRRRTLRYRIGNWIVQVCDRAIRRHLDREAAS